MCVCVCARVCACSRSVWGIKNTSVQTSQTSQWTQGPSLTLPSTALQSGHSSLPSSTMNSRTSFTMGEVLPRTESFLKVQRTPTPIRLSAPDRPVSRAKPWRKHVLTSCYWVLRPPSLELGTHRLKSWSSTCWVVMNIRYMHRNPRTKQVSPSRMHITR